MSWSILPSPIPFIRPMQPLPSFSRPSVLGNLSGAESRQYDTAVPRTAALAGQPANDPPHLYSLGSAQATTRWQWSASERRASAAWAKPAISINIETKVKTDTSAVRITDVSDATVHVPETLKHLMAEVAAHRGQSESDLWAEIARAWLDNRASEAPDDEPPPAAALTRPRPARCWDAIDGLLADLRHVPQVLADTTDTVDERAA